MGAGAGLLLTVTRPHTTNTHTATMQIDADTANMVRETLRDVRGRRHWHRGEGRRSRRTVDTQLLRGRIGELACARILREERHRVEGPWFARDRRCNPDLRIGCDDIEVKTIFKPTLEKAYRSAMHDGVIFQVKRETANGGVKVVNPVFNQAHRDHEREMRTLLCVVIMCRDRNGNYYCEPFRPLWLVPMWQCLRNAVHPRTRSLRLWKVAIRGRRGNGQALRDIRREVRRINHCGR